MAAPATKLKEATN